MKYLCLIYNEEKKLESMSKSESDTFMSDYFVFTEGIRKSGHYLGGEALQHIQTAKTVRIRNGQVPTCSCSQPAGEMAMVNIMERNKSRLRGLFAVICVFVLLGCSHTTAKESSSMDTTGAVAIVTKYLNIMLVESNNGNGLESILSEDFMFDDPFQKASSAREFIGNSQRWIAMRKSYRIKHQFVDGTQVCSVYTIDTTAPSGMSVSFELVDLVELRAGRIAKEKVYFADPVKFAKDMGFAVDYLKQFQ